MKMMEVNLTTEEDVPRAVDSLCSDDGGVWQEAKLLKT
jgi:hypothetical protein